MEHMVYIGDDTLECHTVWPTLGLQHITKPVLAHNWVQHITMNNSNSLLIFIGKCYNLMLQFNVREPQKNVAVLCLHTDAECCNPKCHIKVKFRSSTCHQNVESFLSAAVLIVIRSNLTFNEFNTKNRDFTKDCTNLYQKYFVKSEFLKMNWFWTFLNVCRSSDRKCCHIEITISVLQKYTLHLFHVHNVYCTKPALNEPFTFMLFREQI